MKLFGRRARRYPKGTRGAAELTEDLIHNYDTLEERIRGMAADMAEARNEGLGHIISIAGAFAAIRDDKAWTRDQICVFLAAAISMLPEAQPSEEHENGVDSLVDFIRDQLAECRKSAVDGVCQRHQGAAAHEPAPAPE